MSDDDARTRLSGVRSEPAPGSDLGSDLTRYITGADTLPPGKAPPALVPGALIDRYVVVGRLGEGGMAVVVQAYDPELDRKVAIKVMRGDVFGERGSLGQARMHREAQALAKLSHPNIVQCFDVGTVQGGVFIAMELIRGVNLRTWLKDKPRGWREVVRVFAQAGEGLAAAHAAGIVHRDFKPDNVLVGDDGRVRVVDFGLARPGDDGPGEATPPVVAPATPASDATLTEAGSLIGTPAYMAPEQQLGLAADARSDVFAFAVSLYEAVYGRRPFPGATADEVRRRVLAGDALPPPREARVPPWLHALILRGMSKEPGERHPSMPALLADLTRDRGARLRRLGLGAAFVGLALGWAATAAMAPGAAESTCDEVAGELVGIWDSERRSAVESAMTGSGAAAYAAATWSRTAAALDAYADAWLGEAERNCLAGDGDDREHRDRVRLCLERRRGELEALVVVLAEGSREATEHAQEAVAQLQAPASCTDPLALAADDVAPPTADQLMPVTALRGRLLRARAGLWAGRYAATAAEGAALADEARAIGYAPLLADALLLRATLLTRSGDYPAAEAALTEAYAAAESAGHDRARAEAMVLRLELVGYLMARVDEVAAWTPAAIALVERVLPASALAGRLWANVGMVAFGAGRFADAEVHQRRALALVERVLPADDPERVNALFQLGRTLYKRGDHWEEARATLEAARELAERILGPEHPALVPIYLNVANVYGGHDTERLIAYYERSLALGEKVLGPRHPHVASALANLANTLMSRSREAEALVDYRRAVDIYLETLGESHPMTAINICNLAEALARTGDIDESRTWFARAEAIFGRAYGGPHPDLAVALGGLGETYELEGRWEEARALYHRAAEVAFAGPADPTWHAYAWRRHEVVALLALGLFVDAQAAAKRLLDALPASTHVVERAGVRFLLLQAQAGAGDRAGALADAEHVLSDLRGEPGSEGLVADIDAWTGAVRRAGRGRLPRPPSIPEAAPRPVHAPVANTALPAAAGAASDTTVAVDPADAPHAPADAHDG